LIIIADVLSPPPPKKKSNLLHNTRGGGQAKRAGLATVVSQFAKWKVFHFIPIRSRASTAPQTETAEWVQRPSPKGLLLSRNESIPICHFWRNLTRFCTESALEGCK